MKIWVLLFLLRLVIGQKNPYYFDGHTTMVHLFEWKFEDIARECETFLGPKGFGGVQVSPIQENAVIFLEKWGRTWWERYQPVSYKIVTRSGNFSDFQSMVYRCNRSGVRIYVDLVANHMAAGNGKVVGTGGSVSDVTHRNYSAVSYDIGNFHKSCVINNWSSAFEIRNCELVGLPDLNQTQEHVREKIVEFMNVAIDVGVAGFRVDAAKHMWPDDLENIYSRLNDLNTEHSFPKGARPFIYQEVAEGNEGSVPTDYTNMGTVTEFKHGRELSGLFNGPNKLAYLVSWGQKWNMLPSEDAFVFIDNHDTQRSPHSGILNYKNSKPYKMAVAFMLAHTYGQPRIMSSFFFDDFNQGPPTNQNDEIMSPETIHDLKKKEHKSWKTGWVQEHRWRQIYNMVRFRNTVGFSEISDWWDNGADQIAFCRENLGFVAFNKAHFSLQKELNVCVPPGVYCDVISGDLEGNSCTGKIVYVNEQKKAYIEIHNDEQDGVLAIHVNAKINSKAVFDWLTIFIFNKR